MSSNATHDRRRALMQCVRCGEQDDNTLKGRCLCTKCTKKAAVYAIKYYHQLSDDERKQLNADKSEWKKMLKSQHLCTRCKAQDAYTLNGRSLCAECARKNAAKAKERVKKNPESYKRSQKKLHDRWDAEHRCARCGHKLPSYYTFKTCASCRIKANRQRIERRFREHPEKVLRGTPGYCTCCCSKPVIEGKKLCAECYEKHLISCKKAYEASCESRKNHVWKQYPIGRNN